jgi:hypothetical protein
LQRTAIHIPAYIARKKLEHFSCFSYYPTFFPPRYQSVVYGNHTSIAIFWMKFPLYLEEYLEFFEVLEKY